VSVPACATLTRIGINQAPGNGSDYPFVQQSELGWALLDVYLSYADDTCYINAPFYISIYPTAVSPVPAGTVNIRDKDNAIVFSGTLGAGQAWGTDRLICEMLNDTGVLRLVLHKPCFQTLPLNTWTIATEPLDPRTYSKVPKRLETVRVGLDAQGGALALYAGYNVVLEPQDVTNDDGGRFKTRFLIDGVPGAGLGRLTGCDPDAQPIRTINQIGPDAFGNFNMQWDACYRGQRRATVDYGEAEPVGMFASDTTRHSFRVFNDCQPCQACNYFVRTYRGLKVLWDRYATIATTAETVRDQFVSNVARWDAAADCRGKRSLQVIFTAETECRFFVGATYCNYSECCVIQPEMRFTFFRYVGGVPTAVPATATILRSFAQFGTANEEELLPTEAWPVFSYQPELVKAQDTILARLRLCATCSDSDSYGVYVSVHFEDTAYSPDTCVGEVIEVPAALSALWAAEGISTPTTRALEFKLVPANPAKEPFGCGCN
jgi:hypothetical protein